MALDGEEFSEIFEPERSNGERVRCHHVHSYWLDDVWRETFRKLMFSGKVKLYWNEKEINEAQSAVGLVQIS